MPENKNEQEYFYLPGDENAGGSFRYRTVTPGDYDAEVREAEFGESKASGSPMITITFGIEASEGRALAQDYLVMSEKTMWKFDEFALAFAPELLEQRKRAGSGRGVSVPMQARIDESGATRRDIPSLVGKRGRLRLRQETFDGKTRMKVGDYIPMPRAATAPTTTTPAPASETHKPASEASPVNPFAQEDVSNVPCPF